MDPIQQSVKLRSWKMLPVWLNLWGIFLLIKTNKTRNSGKPKAVEETHRSHTKQAKI